MKIFISWSGDKSKAIAAELKKWIPTVIQAVKPYFSPDDIDKGARWGIEISKELEQAKIGIICLTRDNLQAPWIMFESGAISKYMEKSKVCTMLFGVEASDIEGPLVQFQATPFSEEEIKKLLMTINAELGGAALETNILESSFKKWWPDLNSSIQAILSKKDDKAKSAVRGEREILDEVLALARAIHSQMPEVGKVNRADSILPRGFHVSLLNTNMELVQLCGKDVVSIPLLEKIEELLSMQVYLLRKVSPEARFLDGFGKVRESLIKLRERIVLSVDDPPF